MGYDVVIVGGGPAGLSAALALGRARRRVSLFDAGARRNARAEHLHNFVTRDGTPPAEFRRLAREELARYPNVDVNDRAVLGITGERGAFEVETPDGSVSARRVLLCTGMVDELPELEGLAELWGTSVFQCPYCHGWEVQDEVLTVLATSDHLLELALLLRGWSRDVVALTHGAQGLSSDVRARLEQGRVRVDERRVVRLAARDGRLHEIHFDAGEPLRARALFARPPQRQVPLVAALGLALDDGGFVRVDAQTRETSRPGVYAAGDLSTAGQAAMFAASTGVHAAAALNHALTLELALRGELA